MKAEIRFMKCVAELASLDFLCRLLWFDLLFSVEYYLGMIGMRHWRYFCLGVKLDTGFDSNFRIIDVDLTWWCQFDFLYWLLGSELLFSVEYYLGTHSMKVKQFLRRNKACFESSRLIWHCAGKQKDYDFLCWLLWFKLLFSVEYYLGILSIR